MAEEVEMTPISEAEGGSLPPKVAPFGAAPVAEKPAEAAAPSPAASTIRLKPVIRKPSIHKPTIGGPKPIVPSVAPAAAKKATQNLKSVTGPIPVAASLKKTGIIAEGIITPAQQQASKSKTSRISLESAIGVAPVKEGPAPLKTIRLRRPTDIKPAGPTPLTPAAPAAAAPAPAPAAAPAPAPVAEAPVADLTPVADLSPVADADDSQKKTLKLHRPSVGIKRPTIGVTPAAPDAPADAPVADMAPIAPMDFGAAPAPAKPDVPAWLTAVSLVTGIAALVVIGLVTWYLWQEGVGPAAGANEMQFIQM